MISCIGLILSRKKVKYARSNRATIDLPTMILEEINNNGNEASHQHLTPIDTAFVDLITDTVPKAFDYFDLLLST